MQGCHIKPGGRKTMAQRLIAGFACPIGSSPVRDERTRRSLVAISQCFPGHFLKKTPEISLFYILKPRPTITIAPSPTHGVVGRVTPCAPLLASRPTSYPGCHFPIALLNTLKKQIMQVPLLESVPSLRLWPFSSMRSACSPGISSRRLPGLRGHRPRHV